MSLMSWRLFQTTPPESSEQSFGGENNLPPIHITVTAPEAPVAPPKYSVASTETAAEYAFAQTWLAAEYGIQEGDAGAYTNAYAQSYYAENGRWPTFADLYIDNDYRNGAARVASGANGLPQYFWVTDENGGRTLYDNRSIVGPYPMQVQLPESFMPLRHFIEEQAALGPYERKPGMEYAGYVLRKPYEIPVLTSEMLQEMFNRTAPPPTSGGGSGGGSAGPIFDKKLVMENITNIWRNLLLEEPGNVSTLADNYIMEAQAFARRGGSLNLETWARGTIRKTGRYGVLYGKKPESLSEDQYINQYRQAAGQFGLNEDWTSGQIEAGLSSGAGVAGFTERLAGTRKAMTASTGAWSQRFASSLGEMGLAGRMN